MSLPVTIALSLVVILLGVAIPALMNYIGGITGSFMKWSSLLVIWLADVFVWVLIQFHLYSLAPDYFPESGGLWAIVNTLAGISALVLVVMSYFATLDA